MGSDESLRLTMGRVQMQNFINETQSMESLLEPIVKPLQELQHEKPRWKEEEEAAVEEADKTLFWLDDEEGKTERAIPKGIPPDQTAPLRFKGLPAPEDLDKPKEKPKNDEGDGEEDDEDIEIGGNRSEAMKALMLERKKRAEAEKSRLEALKKKRDRRAKMHRPVVTRIPWHLL